jgi:hypothetical protein
MKCDCVENRYCPRLWWREERIKQKSHYEPNWNRLAVKEAFRLLADCTEQRVNKWESSFYLLKDWWKAFAFIVYSKFSVGQCLPSHRWATLKNDTQSRILCLSTEANIHKSVKRILPVNPTSRRFQCRLITKTIYLRSVLVLSLYLRLSPPRDFPM